MGVVFCRERCGRHGGEDLRLGWGSPHFSSELLSQAFSARLFPVLKGPWYLSFPSWRGQCDSIPGSLCWAQGSPLTHASPHLTSHSLLQWRGEIPDRKTACPHDLLTVPTHPSILITQHPHSDASSSLWTPCPHFRSLGLRSSDSAGWALRSDRPAPTWSMERAVSALGTCCATFWYRRDDWGCEHGLAPPKSKLIYSLT